MMCFRRTINGRGGVVSVSRSGNDQRIQLYNTHASSSSFQSLLSSEYHTHNAQFDYEPFGKSLQVLADVPPLRPCHDLCGPQAMNSKMLLPLKEAEGRTVSIFVNAKQYHRILHRRLVRAKQQTGNKAFRFRKPYLHESRHLHAMRRARGRGGRFLNTKKNKKITDDKQQQQLTGSDVMQLSVKEGSTSPGFENMDMSCGDHEDVDLIEQLYIFDKLHPPIKDNTTTTTTGVAFTTKWITAAAASGGCYDHLLKV